MEEDPNYEIFHNVRVFFFKIRYIHIFHKWKTLFIVLNFYAYKFDDTTRQGEFSFENLILPPPSQWERWNSRSERSIFMRQSLPTHFYPVSSASNIDVHLDNALRYRHRTSISKLAENFIEDSISLTGKNPNLTFFPNVNSCPGSFIAHEPSTSYFHQVD